MDYLVRYFLNLIRDDYSQSQAWARATFEIHQYNPIQVARAFLTAFATREAANYLSQELGVPLENITGRTGDIPIEYGREYSRQELLEIFPSLVGAPYAVRITVRQTGTTRTGYGTFNTYILESETVQDVIDRIKTKLEEDYGIKITKGFRFKSLFIIGRII